MPRRHLLLVGALAPHCLQSTGEIQFIPLPKTAGIISVCVHVILLLPAGHHPRAPPHRHEAQGSLHQRTAAVEERLLSHRVLNHTHFKPPLNCQESFAHLLSLYDPLRPCIRCKPPPFPPYPPPHSHHAGEMRVWGGKGGREGWCMGGRRKVSGAAHISNGEAFVAAAAAAALLLRQVGVNG